LSVFGLRQDLALSKVIQDDYAEFLARATAFK
jgi:hypothetical protein